MIKIESKKRSLVKAITWRLVAMVVLGFVSYFFTRNFKEMGEITIFYTIIQIIFYFLHERLWEKISWGRIKHPLSELPVSKHLKPEDRKIIEEKLKELGYID